MAQRVALARAFINLPDLLVLDEPFGALDTLTRMTMQEELLRILDQEDTTGFMVTHDVDEAIFVSDKIVVLSSRPALTKEVFCVNLSKPRKRTDNDFLEFRARIMEEFYG
jgi:sulfonate transport system ATP-binding protein